MKEAKNEVRIYSKVGKFKILDISTKQKICFCVYVWVATLGYVLLEILESDWFIHRFLLIRWCTTPAALGTENYS